MKEIIKKSWKTQKTCYEFSKILQKEILEFLTPLEEKEVIISNSQKKKNFSEKFVEKINKIKNVTSTLAKSFFEISYYGFFFSSSEISSSSSSSCWVNGGVSKVILEYMKYIMAIDVFENHIFIGKISQLFCEIIIEIENVNNEDEDEDGNKKKFANPLFFKEFFLDVIPVFLRDIRFYVDKYRAMGNDNRNENDPEDNKMKEEIEDDLEKKKEVVDSDVIMIDVNPDDFIKDKNKEMEIEEEEDEGEEENEDDYEDTLFYEKSQSYYMKVITFKKNSGMNSIIKANEESRKRKRSSINNNNNNSSGNDEKENNEWNFDIEENENNKLENILSPFVVILKFLKFYLENFILKENNQNIITEENKEVENLENDDNSMDLEKEEFYKSLMLKIFHNTCQVFSSLIHSNSRIHIFFLISCQKKNDVYEKILNLSLSISSIILTNSLNKSSNLIQNLIEDINSLFQSSRKSNIHKDINTIKIDLKSNIIFPDNNIKNEENDKTKLRTEFLGYTKALLSLIVEEEIITTNIFKPTIEDSVRKFSLLKQYKNFKNVEDFYHQIFISAVTRINFYIHINDYSSIIFIFIWKSFLLVKSILILKELIKMEIENNLLLKQENSIILNILKIIKKNNKFFIDDGTNFLTELTKQFIVFGLLEERIAIENEYLSQQTLLDDIKDVKEHTSGIDNFKIFSVHIKLFDFQNYIKNNYEKFFYYLLVNPKRLELFHFYGIIPEILKKAFLLLNDQDLPVEKFSIIFSVVYLILERFEFSEKKRNKKFLKQLVIETTKIKELKEWYYSYIIQSDMINYSPNNEKIFQYYLKNCEKNTTKIKPPFSSIDILSSTSKIVKTTLKYLIERKLTSNQALMIFCNFCSVGMFAEISFIFCFSMQTQYFRNYNNILVDVSHKLFSFLDKNKKLTYVITSPRLSKVFKIMDFNNIDQVVEKMRNNSINLKRFPYIIAKKIEIPKYIKDVFLKSNNFLNLNYKIEELLVLKELKKRYGFKNLFEILVCKKFPFMLKEHKKDKNKLKITSEVLGIILNSNISKFLIDYVPFFFFEKPNIFIKNYINFVSIAIVVLIIIKSDKIDVIKKFFNFLVNISTYNQNETLRNFSLQLLTELSRKLPEIIRIHKGVNVKIANLLLKYDLQRYGIYLFNLKNKKEMKKCLKYSNHLINIINQ